MVTPKKTTKKKAVSKTTKGKSGSTRTASRSAKRLAEARVALQRSDPALAQRIRDWPGVGETVCLSSAFEHA